MAATQTRNPCLPRRWRTPCRCRSRPRSTRAGAQWAGPRKLNGFTSAPNRRGNAVIIPLGLTTGLYVLLAAALTVRGYGRWFLRMWRR